MVSVMMVLENCLFMIDWLCCWLFCCCCFYESMVVLPFGLWSLIGGEFKYFFVQEVEKYFSLNLR